MSILIFGGTMEGRQVSEYLAERHIRHTVCVATEYGEEVLRTNDLNVYGRVGSSCQVLAEKNIGIKGTKHGVSVSASDTEWRTVHQGRMDVEQMREFLQNNLFMLVVDATHPYAVEVSKNIREACEKEQVPYVRYLRPESGGATADHCTSETADMVETNRAAESGNNADGNNAESEDGSMIGHDRESDCSRNSDRDKKSDSDIMAYSRSERENANNDRPPDGNERTPWAVYVDSTLEAAEYLETQRGSIFLTTGSKELHVFTEHISDKTRLFVRVLPAAEVLTSCRSLGLEGKQICAMQGPFSTDINMAMLRQTHASFLVTKDTGVSGGFPEKLEAARECGITAVVIRRPKESGAGWDEVRARIDEALGCTAQERSAVKMDEELQQPVMNQDAEAFGEQENSGCASPRHISCIGIGMGTPDTMTHEAAREIRDAQIIFGAKRMLECAQTLFQTAAVPQMVAEYSASKIYAWLEAHPQVRRAAILMSGDVGFYSGARQIAEVFPAGEVHYYCGISSVVYFASRIPTSWQDAKLLSAHGKDLALTNYVKKYPKIILLVSGEKDISRLCLQLVLGGMGYVKVTIGANLSYPDEWIDIGTPGDFLDYAADVEQHREKLLQPEECFEYTGSCPAPEEASGAASFKQEGITDGVRTALPDLESKCSVAGLYIMMVENANGGQIITPGIPDQEFVRGDVPMTKEEIRALSVAKLRLKEDSVVYDIGAGTGSVSIECALLCTAGWVYAIERNPGGTELIRQNSRQFGAANISIIKGTAPEALQELPAPTHAFIGGSSGNMRKIIETLLEKNPSVRIVINTVTLESIAEVMNLIRKLHLADADIVQISAARSRALGSYHLMTAHNPVYIVSFGGEKRGVSESV
ncbi:MAG: precorrin-6Y C5,15-methyltransferase (decarboxylating) subunit CbiT [Lachnospiraceae bacterium]|nr:precorrin-6Y C5,15-methyltransferase (decarboxylating) subunit CbiT [Lachnospiraceae bacterium]